MRKSSTTKSTSTIETLTAEIEALRLENDALKRRVEKLNKLFFGPSSEKRPAPDAPSGNAAQGHLFLVERMAEAQSTADRKGVCGSISAAPAKSRPPTLSEYRIDLREHERRLDQAQDGRRVVPVTPSDISQVKGPPPKNPGPPPPPTDPPSARHYATYTVDPMATYEANEQTARYPGEKPTPSSSPCHPSGVQPLGRREPVVDTRLR